MVTGIETMQPGGGNVLNGNSQQLQTIEPVKRASDNRRSNKPIMEKRRRARINNCLNELKTLILDATKKDPARHSKLEKADILEKTVKHLQDLQRQQTAMSQAADPNIVNKFKAGFTECAKEVDRFHGLDPVVKRRLLQHLSNYLNGVKSDQHLQQIQQVQIHMLPSSPPGSPKQDNQIHQQQQILQITPTNGYYLKLPNGVFTYVSPQQLPQATLPTLVPIPSRTSSTASAASNSSTYDRLSRDTTNSPTSYGPPSPANSYEAMDFQTSPTRIQTILKTEQMQRPYSPVPLSLVMKKSSDPQEEERPWRPW